jgi:hypothetical protein
MEYGGTRLTTPDEAVVLVNVSWQRVDESILRGTALKQKWVRVERRWVISEEAIAGGHKGLLKVADPTDVEGAADKIEDPDALPLTAPAWGDDTLGVGVGSGL